MTTEIMWEEPAPSKRGIPKKSTNPEATMRKYEPFVNELKKNPNRWAVFKKAASPTFSTRLKEAYPGIETTCRRIECEDNKQRFDIYARWIG